MIYWTGLMSSVSPHLRKNYYKQLELNCLYVFPHQIILVYNPACVFSVKAVV